MASRAPAVDAAANSAPLRIAARSVGGALAWRWSVFTAVLFLLASAVLAGGRFSHVDQRPLEITAVLLVAAVAVCVASLVRLPLLCWLPRAEMSISRATVLVAPSLALVMLLAFLSASTNIPTVVFIGGVFGLTEAWLVGVAFNRSRLEQSTTPTAEAGIQPENENHLEYSANAEGALESPPNGVWQQLTRTRNAEGGECMTGRIVLEFAAGQRNQLTHVAFCPPWPKAPAVEAECVDGWPSEVRIDQIEPHGVRFEVRLSPPPTERCETVFVFTAGADEA